MDEERTTNRPAGLESQAIYVMARLPELRGIKGAFLAPDLPPKVVANALNTYLHLRPDELLLAIVDPTKGRRGAGGFALTTRRFYWWESRGRAKASAREESGGSIPRGSRTASYENLPEPVGVTGSLGPTLLLGERRVPTPRGIGHGDLERLAGFLREVSQVARGEASHGLPQGEESRALDALPEVARLTESARAAQAGIRSFAVQLRAATPRLVATPLFALACIGAFVAMVASGVSPESPSAEDLYAWGANFAPAVVVDGERWRLLTSIFLHIGLLHLALNLWCLLSIGPLVERLFGNLGFAALYLISGIGGTLASIVWNPLVISAGASGAIFGVCGGLLGFLVVHRRAVPVEVLRPQRASVLSFVGYNMLFGLLTPGIDNAAHLGGLATGFACGVLLQRPWPVVPGASGAGRRLAWGGVLAGGLALVSLLSDGPIRARLGQDPRFGPFLVSDQAAVDVYNDYATAVGPRAVEMDRILMDLVRIEQRLDAPMTSVGSIQQDLDRLTSRAQMNLAALDGLTSEDPVLRDALGNAAEAQRHLVRAMLVLRGAIASGDLGLLNAPQGYMAAFENYHRAVERSLELQEDYIKVNHLIIEGDDF